jgi:hypothetical protein
LSGASLVRHCCSVCGSTTTIWIRYPHAIRSGIPFTDVFLAEALSNRILVADTRYGHRGLVIAIPTSALHIREAWQISARNPEYLIPGRLLDDVDDFALLRRMSTPRRLSGVTLQDCIVAVYVANGIQSPAWRTPRNRRTIRMFRSSRSDGVGLPESQTGRLRITLFEACSAFTHVTACMLARSPKKRPSTPKASVTP